MEPVSLPSFATSLPLPVGAQTHSTPPSLRISGMFVIASFSKGRCTLWGRQAAPQETPP